MVGPWYVLPDEFLVSGESLIRNLEMGRKLARGLGVEPSNAGFLCDMFGHNSQMPQIFNGFGIPMAFHLARQQPEQQPAGDLARGGRHRAAQLPFWRGGLLHLCRSRCGRCRAGRRRTAWRRSRARQAAFLANENAKTETGPLLAFDGGDHLAWDPADYAVLGERFNEDGDYHVVHSTLDAYMAEMLAFRGEISARLEGELRDPGYAPDTQETQWLIPGVGSSRVPLKLANAACQSLLCQWAEPLNAFAHLALGR